MKKFFKEFKEFISRGNVMDLAVGMIIGSAFTAIVTALTNGILKPLINWFFYAVGGGSIENTYTFLHTEYTTDAVSGAQIVDLANSIYIDWGAFISAIINFILIAFVLFIIVKAMNKAKEEAEKAKAAVAAKKNENKVQEETATEEE